MSLLAARPLERLRGENLLLLYSFAHCILPIGSLACLWQTSKHKAELLAAVHRSIEFGGQAPSKMFLRRYTGYVEQFDTLIGELTVQEMVGGGLGAGAGNTASCL
jgi:hypothetical protein